MKEILIRGKVAAGQVALVDDADYALASRYRLFLRTPQVRNGVQQQNAYVIVIIPTGHRGAQQIYLHTLLTGWDLVDHQDGNPLNCTRENMREATSAENARNARPQRGRSSAYKGVSRHSQCARWVAQIKIDGHKQHLGLFADEITAALTYDTKATELFGEFAWLNRTHFPEVADQYPAFS